MHRFECGYTWLGVQIEYLPSGFISILGGIWLLDANYEQMLQQHLPQYLGQTKLSEGYLVSRIGFSSMQFYRIEYLSILNCVLNR